MSSAETTTQRVQKILRFPLEYRIEHWIFATSFIILGITGLVQKYFEWPVSVTTIQLLGGIDTVRIIHRISATVMMVAVVYHIAIVGYRLYVKRFRLSMMPGVDDGKNLLGWFLYNLGLQKRRPQEGRYTYGEKMEYWAVAWGTVIMVVTGFMMWNPIATTRLLDGQWIPAAKVAHGGEAVLAVLAIILWHFYHVLVRTFNRSMFNGYLTEEQMADEHPLELADYKAGVHEVKLKLENKRKRQRQFIPTISIVSGFLLVGIIWFVTFEQTALETVTPIETVEIFSPLTPTPFPTAAPSPTPRPTPPPEAAAVDWNNVIGPMLQSKCRTCHGGAAATAGLSLETYQSALAGGESGPGIVPGEPDSSYLVIIQRAGNHPVQLDATELEILVHWVNAGAPESLGAAAPGAGSVPTFQDNIAAVFQASCGTCHGESALGGLNLTTYDAVIAGGANGPVILPGDPAGSSLVEIQVAGGHPGQLSEADLELVRRWIEAGAPNTAADVQGSAASTESGGETSSASLTYGGEISVLFQEKCGMCHGDSALGGLNLLTYSSAIAGGADGPVIVPGNPDGSSLVEIQAAGGHAGQFTDEELVKIRDWIAAGAPE
jgi:cytochrome b subunit of formate dehydrogenase/mono/diheme cytochrome c family protein